MEVGPISLFFLTLMGALAMALGWAHRREALLAEQDARRDGAGLDAADPGEQRLWRWVRRTSNVVLILSGLATLLMAVAAYVYVTE